MGKVSTDQEKADKPTSGLQGALLRDVTCLSPTNPSDFLMKASRAVQFGVKIASSAEKTSQRVHPIFFSDNFYDARYVTSREAYPGFAPRQVSTHDRDYYDQNVFYHGSNDYWTSDSVEVVEQDCDDDCLDDTCFDFRSFCAKVYQDSRCDFAYPHTFHNNYPSLT